MFTKLTDENRRPGTIGIIILAAIGLMLFSAQSKADTGFFIGGSVGQAGIELNDGDPVLPVVVDEDDLGYKLFAGYNWQFTILSLGVEAGYVNLGKPSADIPGFGVLDIETTGLNAFGVLGVQLGPIGLFGKLGVMSWEADLSLDGIPDPTGSEDGTEPMYGVGAKVDIGSLGIRLEYEAIDLDADGVSESDANMISLGLTWTF